MVINITNDQLSIKKLLIKVNLIFRKIKCIILLHNPKILKLRFNKILMNFKHKNNFTIHRKIIKFLLHLFRIIISMNYKKIRLKSFQKFLQIPKNHFLNLDHYHKVYKTITKNQINLLENFPKNIFNKFLTNITIYNVKIRWTKYLQILWKS